MGGESSNTGRGRWAPCCHLSLYREGMALWFDSWPDPSYVSPGSRPVANRPRTCALHLTKEIPPLHPHSSMMESWGAEATCAQLAAQINLSEASRGLLGFSLARDAVWGATPTLLPVAVTFPAVNCLSSCHQTFLGCHLVCS